MTTEEQYDNVVCPTEDELISHKISEGKLCPVIECGKSIKNPSAMRMHLAQTHGIGAENVLQTFNKAFIVANQTTKSLYACPVFTCSRTYGSGRYFKALSTLREVILLCLSGADLESILTVAHKGVVGNIIRNHTHSFKDIHPPLI